MFLLYLPKTNHGDGCGIGATCTCTTGTCIGYGTKIGGWWLNPKPPWNSSSNGLECFKNSIT